MPGVRLVGNPSTTGLVLSYRRLPCTAGAKLTLGTLTAFLLYLRIFFEPMQEISQVSSNTFQSGRRGHWRRSPGCFAEAPGNPGSGAIRSQLDAVKGDIGFHDVHFSYAPGRPVLPELDLAIPAGQTVALVGTTGAGKNHHRQADRPVFYDPTSGAVDPRWSRAARTLRRPSWRRHVVMVTQENFMFEGTVADNIRFGRPDATDDEVAGRGRGSWRRPFVIDALTDGYDTDVAKRGGRLSAGQRQLIAFARAFLADPRGAIPSTRRTLVARHPQRGGWSSERWRRCWQTAPAVVMRAPAVDGSDRGPGAGARTRANRRRRPTRRTGA